MHNKAKSSINNLVDNIQASVDNWDIRLDIVREAITKRIQNTTIWEMYSNLINKANMESCLSSMNQDDENEAQNISDYLEASAYFYIDDLEDEITINQKIYIYNSNVVEIIEKKGDNYIWRIYTLNEEWKYKASFIFFHEENWSYSSFIKGKNKYDFNCYSEPIDSIEKVVWADNLYHIVSKEGSEHGGGIRYAYLDDDWIFEHYMWSKKEELNGDICYFNSFFDGPNSSITILNNKNWKRETFHMNILLSTAYKDFVDIDWKPCMVIWNRWWKGHYYEEDYEIKGLEVPDRWLLVIIDCDNLQSTEIPDVNINSLKDKKVISIWWKNFIITWEQWDITIVDFDTFETYKAKEYECNSSDKVLKYIPREGYGWKELWKRITGWLKDADYEYLVGKRR